MICFGHEFKVVKPVITPVYVDVVNMLFMQQLASYVFFHHKTMFKLVFPIANVYKDVPHDEIRFPPLYAFPRSAPRLPNW
jgi:hypothetical protein